MVYEKKMQYQNHTNNIFEKRIWNDEMMKKKREMNWIKDKDEIEEKKNLEPYCETGN